MSTAVDRRTRQVQQWSLREANATAKVTTRAQQSIAPLWATFAGWYAATQTARLAQQSLDVVQPAREAVGAIATGYMGEVLAALGAPRRASAKLQLPPARQGADMVKVYSRPAAEYRDVFSMTGDQEAAVQAAVARFRRLVEDDIMLAQRDGEHETMVQAGIERYRRIIHPELSESRTTCGLCIAASQRIYRIQELRPVHGHCNCSSAPLAAGYDPQEANEVDLKAVYAAAGDSTNKDQLKRTRFAVNEHGELGPVLTVKGQKFRGRDDLAQRRDPEQNRRDLQTLNDVLAQLTRRSKDGEDLADPLAYQRRRIERLTHAA